MSGIRPKAGILKNTGPKPSPNVQAAQNMQWQYGGTTKQPATHYTVNVKPEEIQKASEPPPPVAVPAQPAATEEPMDVEKTAGGKRKRPFMYTRKNKRPKLEPKNPVLLLNELKSGLEYTMLDPDSSTNTTASYRFSTVVNNVMYIGEAQSKKEARQKAAENALRGQITLKNNDIWDKLARRVTNTPADGEITEAVSDERLFKLIATRDSAEPLVPKEKHPVMLLNEYVGDSLTYECIEESESDTQKGNKKKYTMRVVINEKNYEGTARNIKAAKAQAARLALAKLYNVFVPDADIASSNMNILKDSVTLLGDLHKTHLYYEMTENTGGTGGGRTIVMKTTVNGVTFEGKGKTKKQAKAAAAQAALAQLYGLTGEVAMSPVSGVSLFRSPVTVLQHYNGPQTVYELTEAGEGPSRSITASVTVGDEKFSGTGQTKKIAKSQAARSALSKVYKVDIPDEAVQEFPPVFPFVGKKRRMPPFPFPMFPHYSGYTSFASPVPQMLNQPMMIPARFPGPGANFGRPPTQALIDVHKAPVSYECIKEEKSGKATMYTMQVMIHGKPYQGEGKSKKEARWAAAGTALKEAYNINAPQHIPQPMVPMNPVPGFAPAAAPTAAMTPTAPVTTNGTPNAPDAKWNKAEMHPVMLLNQLSGNQKHEYACIQEEGEGTKKIYSMQVVSGGKTFVGQAANKKDARAAAAKRALEELFNIKQPS